MMKFFKFLAVGGIALPGVAGLLPESIASRIIIKDVAIIGGGASGAYAAVRLKEDFGKSVVLIEKEPELGGHVDTYETDPDTGLPVDYGVMVWNDYGPARAFFERMNVSVSNPRRPVLTPRYADFKTGLPVNYTPAEFLTQVLPAIQRFYDIVLPWESYLLPGYWNFPQPSQIPEDLLLPFGQFVKKHHLEPALNGVFSSTGFGVGDLMNTLTIWVLAAYNTPMLRLSLGLAGAFIPTSGRNVEIYEAMAARLAGDVLYQTTTAQTIRTTTQGVVLWVRSSATGKYTLIRAKKLLIAVEPTKDNTAALDLDLTEKAVFSKLEYSIVQGGLISHPSLPANVSLVNIPGAAVLPNATTDYTIFPKPPFSNRFDHFSGTSKLWRVVTVGREGTTTAQAQKLVRDNFNALVAEGILPGTAGSSPLQIKAWSNHGPMHARVSAAELRAGFLQKLYALEGRRSTWWTGGAFSVNFQSILWAFDDVLLPKLVVG